MNEAEKAYQYFVIAVPENEEQAKAYFWARKALQSTLTQPPITGDTSDGYHTFNELYHHRAVLFSVICNEHHDIVWKSKKHHDGTMYDGMFIVGIDTPEGQATYHYDIDPYWNLFRVKELELAPEWDGHTPGEAIRRIGTLTPPNEPEHAGLYGKYTVYKNKDGSLVTDCFILRPAKDPAAVAALRAYAAATDNAELAADIINWVGAKPNEALTLEQLREMDGQPAWCEDVGRWAIVSVSDAGKWKGVPFALFVRDGGRFEWDIEDRGLCMHPYPPAQQRWIPVSERLPEYNPGAGQNAYWIAKKNRRGEWEMKIALYCDYGYAMSVDVPSEVTWRDYDYCKITNVTHWMPLPEPPEEG